MHRDRNSIILIVGILVVLLIITIGLFKFIQPTKEESIETSQIAIPTTTPEPVEAITPTPIPTYNPGASSGTDLIYDLIDDVPIIKKFDIAHLSKGQWTHTDKDFTSANQTYKSGLGMFIPSMSISESWGNDEISFDLDGKYKKIQFDIFVDTEGAYGISSEFGLYRIGIYADGHKIYDSNQLYYNDIIDDIVIFLPDNTNTLKVSLIQKKGTNGTLDVVIGDFFLYQVKQPIPTPYITSPPYTPTSTVWINVSALKIRSRPEFGSYKLGKIPYGQIVSGYVNGDWMNVSYDGVEGYIYLGRTSSGRDCVVNNEGDLEPLE